MKKEWANDCTIICNSCESISKSYFLEESGETNFCPNCGSRDVEQYEED